MRIAFVFAFATFVVSATCGVAQEPAAQIVRNPYYFDSALVGDRYQLAPPATPPTTTEASPPATERPAAPRATAPSRSAERMQALSTAFGRTSAPLQRAAPRRFTPPTDAKPLTTVDRENTDRAVTVVPASLELDANDGGSSVGSLTAAVANRMAVTRLAANPLRGAESTSSSVAPSAVVPVSNPLR